MNRIRSVDRPKRVESAIPLGNDFAQPLGNSSQKTRVASSILGFFKGFQVPSHGAGTMCIGSGIFFVPQVGCCLDWRLLRLAGGCKLDWLVLPTLGWWVQP